MQIKKQEKNKLMFSFDKYLNNTVGAGLCACPPIIDFCGRALKPSPTKFF